MEKVNEVVWFIACKEKIINHSWKRSTLRERLIVLNLSG